MFSADRTLGSNRWPVVRLVPGSQTEIVLLSPSFFAITTHWNKCTVPCSGEDCDLCQLLPSRGLFYVACVCASQVRMLELGSQSASHFEQHCKLLHGGMRPGLLVSLSRRTQKSPVFTEVIGFKEQVAPISTLVLANHVMALFKFPPANPGECVISYEKRCRVLAKVRNARMAELLTSQQNRAVHGR